IDPADVVALAREAIPTDAPAQVPVNYDESQKAWLCSSPNPNLRILGPGVGQTPQGIPVVGFSIVLGPSVMNAARYRDRYLLLDGYHRAVGFLLRDITHVPILVREAPSFEDLRLPGGMLPQDAFLGSRPPVLADYLDNEVAADVCLPVTQRTIVITALEVNSGS
ncbi:MAG TPA: hypothetical protein VKV02_05915, partial [Acidobacteriaceae bacterium]|nr:hypothetical protein [Acidobacteriaceae bacterium]